MRLGGLGLDTTDTCYDPNRPWYVPNWWMTDAECACVAAQGRPLGEQCATFTGVIDTMAGQAGAVLGGGANAVGEGIGTGLASGVGNFANSVNLSGLMLLTVAGLAIFALKK